MDKNCLDCFNFNDNTSTCKTMQEPPENCFCFVANIKQKLEQEKSQIENRLNLLSGSGILYNNNGVYELMRGDRKDIQRLVEQFKSNPDNRPTNLLDRFLELNPIKCDDALRTCGNVRAPS